MLSRQWWLDKEHVRGNNFVLTNKIWFYIRMEVQFWISTRVILWQCFQWNVFRRKICRIMYSMNDVIAVMVSRLHCITVVIGIRMMLLWKCITEWLIDFSALYRIFQWDKGTDVLYEEIILFVWMRFGFICCWYCYGYWWSYSCVLIVITT